MTDEHIAELIRRYWLAQGYPVDCRVVDTVVSAVAGHKTWIRKIVSNLESGLPARYRNGVNGVELGVPCRRTSHWRAAA